MDSFGGRLAIEKVALGHPVKIANNPLAVKRESQNDAARLNYY
jgi:hypothetical protein